MTDCGWLSDRIPPIVLGHAEWTPQELQHLQECRACQQEWEVVRAANRLGGRGEAAIDAEAVAGSVLRRLRDEPRPTHIGRRTWAVSGLAAAAAIVVALWAGNVGAPDETTRQSGSLAAAQLEIPLPELENLQAAELDTVLQGMDEPNNLRDPGDEEPELSDLNSDELQRVLDTWEG
jgi:negative regulator of sigma E activity